MIISRLKKHILSSVIVSLCFIVNLMFIDVYLLPRKTLKDKLKSYKEISYNHTNRIGIKQRTHIGYKYITANNNTFSSIKFYIEEENIEIEYTRIFNFFTNIKTTENKFNYLLMRNR